MSRIHARRLAVLPLVALLLAPAGFAGVAPHEWRFTALLDGKEIGYQTFRLAERGAERVLTSEARYNVKFLFMNVYDYTHKDKEVWRDDCLERIDSRTDDNGERFFVRGGLDESRLTIETVTGVERLPVCVMTFAYWNPRILEARRLLNAQTGEYMDVKVTPRGRDSILAAGRVRPADRYELTTEKFSIDVWYSPESEWLGLETTTDSGRRLRYRLD